MYRYLGAVILILISVLISLVYPKTDLSFFEQHSSNSPTHSASEDIALNSGETESVQWQTLQKLDYKTNQIQDETLKSIIDKHVRIPGFAVPLTDNLQAVSEFLLVPNQMACIHVPPPPPNLIVFVRLEKPMKIEHLMGPLWVSGILKHKTLSSIYGSSSYEMAKVSVKPYEF